LFVGNPASRSQPLAVLDALGLGYDEADDPYTGFVELCRRPMTFHAVLSLWSLYREELQVIRTIKRQFPHMDVWLAHADGGNLAIAEAIRLGADGLLCEDGLHRIGLPEETAESIEPVVSFARELHSREEGEPSNGNEMASALDVRESRDDRSAETERERIREPLGESEYDLPVGEPVLSADELRALLQEQPLSPPRDEL
jgi:hypothetical protein